MKTWHVCVVVAVLTAWVVTVSGLAAYGLTHPKPEVKKADVAAVAANAHRDLGEQDVAKLCEANITTTVVGNGGKVNKLKTLSVKLKGNTATVKLYLDSNIYVGNLTCNLTKSNWTIQGIQ